ncbi:hypothetical protein WT60_13285 [Burkholderia sp. MSMB617WGS]|nr:hypothetical protein WT60_13285 [Burkholderia sp. MSMB617WGS]KWZ41139.1 hypothetical protein WS73_28185 [Burkholderia savannae]
MPLIGPGTQCCDAPGPDEIVEIFGRFAEHPQRKQAAPDVIRVATNGAFHRGERFRLTVVSIDPGGLASVRLLDCATRGVRAFDSNASPS